MDIVYYILTPFFIITAILPFISNQHWIFRIFDFARIQMLVLHLIMLGFGFIFIENRSMAFWLCQGLLMFFITNSSIKLIPYTRFYPVRKTQTSPPHRESISIVSVNVFQFNKKHHLLIQLLRKVNPDIILTMESNKSWEKSLSVLEKEYRTTKKIPMENTYGMHFYTRLKVNKLKVNFFTADDIPSIEVEMETPLHDQFTFFGIHPPPPSPTEEETSKERDGELLSIAKKVRELKGPVLVVGDFNNVAWAKSSILFKRTSNLIDPRIGRGFLSTFHADYKFFRFPIDLFFHSSDIFVNEFKTLEHVGSDHLPMYCSFFINHVSPIQESEVEELKKGEISEVNEMIQEGKKEQSDRQKVVTEPN